MKIIVADPISPIGVDLLKKQAGFEVIEAYGSSPEKIKELVKDACAVIVRSETTISPDVIAASTCLKAVGRAGVGVDNIDIPAATEKGVIVMNTPTGNTIATAELTFTHMLCGARPVAQANASMKAGKWNRGSFKGGELNGKTLAILGMGRIGSEIAIRAMAFNMKVLAYDPFLTEARANSMGVKMVNLDEAFKNADYITVHMPLTPTTKYMINADAFAKMKKGVRVFNCARGGIIEEAALVEALKSGKVAAAGLDVYEDEPPPADSPLLTLDNLVLTPHLGASTKEAQESCGIEVAEIIISVLKDGVIRNAVNAPSVDAESLRQISPYISLCEKLGTYVQQVSENTVEKISIKYFGKLACTDNKLLTLAVQKGYLSKITDFANDVNAPMQMKHLGIVVESGASNVDSDYSELVQVLATCKGGKTRSVAGTVMGKSARPRIVQIDSHEVEVNPLNKCVLLLQNNDTPGMVGVIGSIMGKYSCNIANMTLSRNETGGSALSVYELDGNPPSDAVKELSKVEKVEAVRVIDFV